MLSFDAETNGVYGQAFIIGATVTNGQNETETFVARCPILGPVDPWVRRHVLPVNTDIHQTHSSYPAMLQAFYNFVKKHRQHTLLAFIPVPIEAKILWDIFSNRDELWEGPIPLIDLSSVLFAHEYNPQSDQTYLAQHGLSLPFTGNYHNPLFDARVAAFVLSDIMARHGKTHVHPARRT